LSPRSAPSFILECHGSRFLAGWWLALHALVLASVLAWPLPTAAKLVLIGALIAHAALRRPRVPPCMLRHADGSWSVPCRGWVNLTLKRGTRMGAGWAYLVLAGGGKRLATLVMRDQLTPAAWNTLRAALGAGTLGLGDAHE
jgi:hypothetical protein